MNFGKKIKHLIISVAFVFLMIGLIVSNLGYIAKLILEGFGIVVVGIVVYTLFETLIKKIKPSK